MEEAQQVELQVTVQDTKDLPAVEDACSTTQSTTVLRIRYNRWMKLACYGIIALTSQTVAVLLGRLYYNKGGKSKWMETFVQLAGFVILTPILFMLPGKKSTRNENQAARRPSAFVLASVYVPLGLLIAAICLLYSFGLLYLPLSTFSLIGASQLAFNTFFSFLLNSQRLTPPVLNSVFLLTISSALIVFQNHSTIPTGLSRAKFTIGFLCTLGASACYGLYLSAMEASFCKVIKSRSLKEVIDMAFYPSGIATCAALMGLFISGEWTGIKAEMEEFELGKLSYIMILAWTAIAWQMFTLGLIGLIFEASSLFSNVVTSIGLPIITISSVIFFGDKMDGPKVIALLLALWGSASYIYQQHIDDSKLKTAEKTADSIQNLCP